MPLRGVNCVLGYVSLEDHKSCMLNNPGPPCSIPPAILEMMTRHDIEREAEGVHFSPSSISSCHRQAVLQGSHDFYIPVAQGYKTTRGSIVHAGLENEPPIPGTLGRVTELRMHANLNTKYGEQQFSGKADRIDLLSWEAKRPVLHEHDEKGLPLLIPGETTTTLHVKLTDFKTKTEVTHALIEPEHRHVQQINAYAWLITKYLPTFLNKCVGMGGLTEDECTHLSINAQFFPHIDEVVVDELSIVYMDMSKSRTFTSRGFLYAQGKMLSDHINGHWVRRVPAEYEELELQPVHQFRLPYIESIIRKGIETEIESREMLAAPLTGDDAGLMCRSCPVRQACIETGLREGYNMQAQMQFGR